MKGRAKTFKLNLAQLHFSVILRPEYRSGPGSPHLRGSKTVLDSGFHLVDSGFQVLDSSLYHWTLESGLQLLVGFRIF